MSRLLLFLAVISAGIVLLAIWRLVAIYRRRRRWKMLTTSHQSLHVARRRIVATPPSPDEH